MKYLLVLTYYSRVIVYINIYIVVPHCAMWFAYCARVVAPHRPFSMVDDIVFSRSHSRASVAVTIHKAIGGGTENATRTTGREEAAHAAPSEVFRKVSLRKPQGPLVALGPSQDTKAQKDGGKSPRDK